MDLTKVIEKYPNKYNLTPQSLKTLEIINWDALKNLTWHNEAMKDTGSWWCHLEGCQLSGKPYDDSDEFWIGFREKDNKIDCNFSCYEGMCSYKFTEFYDIDSIDNKFDLGVQINTIIWINKLIDEGILALPKDITESNNKV